MKFEIDESDVFDAAGRVIQHFEDTERWCNWCGDNPGVETMESIRIDQRGVLYDVILCEECSIKLHREQANSDSDQKFADSPESDVECPECGGLFPLDELHDHVEGCVKEHD